MIRLLISAEGEQNSVSVPQFSHRKTCRVRMLRTYDQLIKGCEYFLPEDLAESLLQNNIAVILLLPGDKKPVGPSEIKPAGPKEFKAKKKNVRS